MKRLFLTLILAVMPVMTFQACQHQVTLEAGGAYSDAPLATADQAILDASHTLSGFIEWSGANATYLAKWPEVSALAAKVAVQKDGWIRDAYAARDAYAKAITAYKSATGPTPDAARLNAALAILANVTAQINDYKTAHKNV